MTDTPRDPTDERDERLGALLETQPLDDLTRTRLVRAAMAASAPDVSDRSARGASRRPWYGRARWLGAAAIAILVVVAIVAVMANQTSDKSTSAGAKRASNEGGARFELPTDESAQEVAPASGSSPLASTTLGTLGDLGDVGTAATLRRAVNAALPAAEAATTTITVDPNALRDLSVTAGTEPRCSAATKPPSGRTIASGGGTVDGKPVVVDVVERSDGTRVAVALSRGCVVGRPVPL
jgi:hypothetical protein